MGFSRQEYWSELSCPSPGDLPTLESNPDLPHCRQTFYCMSHQGSPGIYIWKTLIWKGTCTPMFIAALLTIAKIQKQSKCPPTDVWTKKIWCIYIHNRILLSCKKEWNYAICSSMYGLRGYHAKWKKSETERQILYKITSMWYLKNIN